MWRVSRAAGSRHHHVYAHGRLCFVLGAVGEAMLYLCEKRQELGTGEAVHGVQGLQVRHDKEDRGSSGCKGPVYLTLPRQCGLQHTENGWSLRVHSQSMGISMAPMQSNTCMEQDISSFHDGFELPFIMPCIATVKSRVPSASIPCPTIMVKGTSH